MNGRYICTFVCLLVCFCCSCSGSENVPATKKHIVYQLNWTPDPTFADAYIAADKNTGIFAREGLDVDIRPGGYGIDPIAAIVANRAQFAVVGADKAVIAYANGAPIRVVAVEFQRNPVGWIVRRETGVRKIADLVGRTDVVLGDKVGTETTAILTLMLHRLGLEDKVIPQAVGFDTAYFFQNKNCVFPVYLNEEPVTVRVAGEEINEIDPAASENGAIRLYGNVIIANKAFVEKNPTVVQAFKSGLASGWLFAKDHFDEAVGILRRSEGFDTKQMPDVLKRSISFATTFNGYDVPPGHMEFEHWETTFSILKEAGLLAKNMSVGDLVWMNGGKN